MDLSQLHQRLNSDFSVHQDKLRNKSSTYYTQIKRDNITTQVSILAEVQSPVLPEVLVTDERGNKYHNNQ